MMKRLALQIGALVFLAIAAAAQGTATPPQPQRTLVVTGIAERMVSPDVGLVVFAVETQADTVGKAVAANNAASNRVIDAVIKLNISNMTLRTLGFDVQPIYEQPEDNKPVLRPLRIISYQVTNRLEARIPEPGKDQLSTVTGQVLDAGLNAGANRVDSVSFILADDLPVQREILAKATKNARETARVMATAAGVQISRLMTLSSTPFYPQPIPLFSRAAEASQGVPIVAGQLTVQAMVTAVYEIR